MLRLKIKGMPVEIGAGFFIVITFMLLVCDNETVLISVFSSLLHECGHIISMLVCGERVRLLRISASGLCIERKINSALSFSREIIISLSGVCVNFLLSLFSYIIYLLSGGEFLRSVIYVNLAIALFNLLPAGQLDGARGLSFILRRRIPESTADRITDTLSLVTTVILIAFSLVAFYFRAANPSLAVVTIYLSIILINRILELKKSVI